MFSLGRLIHKQRCKAVDVHNVQSLFWGALAARLLNKVPVIATIHSSYRETEKGLKAIAYETVLRLSRPLVYRYIAVSDGDFAARNHTYSATQGLVSDPSPSISTVHTSPGFRNRGGSNLAPAPVGVPETMMSPGISVVKVEI